MKNTIKKIFIPNDDLADEKSRFQVKFLNLSLAFIDISLIGYALFTLISKVSLTEQLWGILPFFVTTLTTRLLIYHGKYDLASRILSLLITFAMIIAAFFTGGIRAPGYQALSVAVLIASLVCGIQCGRLVAGIAIFAGAGLLYAENLSLLPTSTIEPNAESVIQLISSSTYFIAIVYMVQLYFQRLQNALVTANNEISQRVEVEKQLKELDKLKDAFLANTSHEIRTPLNAIVGMTELMLHDEDSSNIPERLQIIHSNSEVLLDLINDLLDFSRIQSKRITLRREVVHFKSYFETTMTLLRQLAQHKGLTLTSTVDESVPEYIELPSSRVRQILLNLINNAIKFTFQGQVSVTVSATAEIDSNINMLFQVTDTGMGIDPSKRDQLFKPFSQLQYNLSRQQRGSGLGLAISKELCQLMGGDIWFESEMGAGTTFYFNIIAKHSDSPGIDATPPEQEQDNDASPSPQTNYRILVIEDNVVNQMVATQMLKQLGYETDLAENGKQGIELLEKQNYHIIFMDIQMPEMDGYETTRYIRENLPYQPYIIALTAHAFDEERAKSHDAGMNDFLQKPFKLNELHQVLDSAHPHIQVEG